MKARAQIRRSIPLLTLIWISLIPVQSAASDAVQSAASDSVQSAASDPYQRWPDPLLVTDWLSRESMLARKFWRETSTEARLVSFLRSQDGTGRSNDAIRSDRPPSGQAKPKPRAVELASIYGVGQQLAADVRIGGVLHRLLPQKGRDFASDQRGEDSIIAEQFSLGCLRLKYRKTQRRLCLSEADVPTEPDQDKKTEAEHVSQ